MTRHVRRGASLDLAGRWPPQARRTVCPWAIGLALALAIGEGIAHIYLSMTTTSDDRARAARVLGEE